MKEMEAKTENRYEYRKPQEKRKQMIAPDLFEFAYVPDWYGPVSYTHLDVYKRQVLALVSTPAYDNNDFIMGLSSEQWTVLNEDENLSLIHI